jgi:predicted acyl esterase
VRIAPGNRLRVTVSSSDFPQWDRNLNTGDHLFRQRPSAAVVATQTVLHNTEHASHLTVHTVRAS